MLATARSFLIGRRALVGVGWTSGKHGWGEFQRFEPQPGAVYAVYALTIDDGRTSLRLLAPSFDHSIVQELGAKRTRCARGLPHHRTGATKLVRSVSPKSVGDLRQPADLRPLLGLWVRIPRLPERIGLSEPYRGLI